MKRVFSICIMLLIMSTYVFAKPNPNWIIQKGYAGDIYMKRIDESKNVKSVTGQLTVILGAAGIAIGTCVGAIYAIMWITSTPAKKADLKERAFPLVLGIVLLFGGTSIAATFISAMTKILQS